MKTDLDIIIPCYNCKDTLFYTLCSIRLQQDVYGFKVYLINDKSDYDYNNEVIFFSKYFYIEEIKLDNNLGPGGARREGINKTNSNYIMFIDSDDLLYDVYSIKNLYYSSVGYDLCISNFIYERDNIRTVKKNDSIWLHGKMYKREFLKKHNINFNNTKANEDNGFNRLVLLMEPRKKVIDKITYVYKDNNKSITRNNNREYKILGLEGFIYNMVWALEEALKRGKKDTFVPYFSNNVLVSMYYDYLYYIDDLNSNLILKYSKDMIKYYRKIENYELEQLLISKENILKEENKTFNKAISFDEFIRKVKDYD